MTAKTSEGDPVTDDQIEGAASRSDEDAPRKPRKKKQQFRAKRRTDVHGWIALDKPLNMTSTQAVGAIKRIFNVKKVGHAGTLDPLATGCLPIAIGEATKTVSFVMDGVKEYEFTVRWGEETATDDAEGELTDSSAHRPTEDEIDACLDHFTGTIMQVPPAFSAIKVNGERAYDLARDGEEVKLAARPITVHELDLVEVIDEDTAVFVAECSKGTYVRSLARDIGRHLGTRGHVIGLRRLLSGPFREEMLISLDDLERLSHSAPDEPGPKTGLADALLPVETALDDIPALAINRNAAARLRRGQSVLLRGQDAPIEGYAAAMNAGMLVAICEIIEGELWPRRVFNLPDHPPVFNNGDQQNNQGENDVDHC
ncbi:MULTISPECIES: tRNA pseudouridine(55) synthase TruB [Cohaesibacter]|uniref:tRNA pseudouridine(55) synthase TruB n=1 Tax=Cohaesibacter TaxID=655352 RepID=UPI000DE95F88|nr:MULTISPECIES: tRNA pseudouridine(55) synthase TruB [Cohaesibacter]TLP47292.1 tRNA pseudouridine(55) synthase TruB [Cohaesibacter sp. CAU 1516]